MTSLRIDVCSQKLNARQALLAERADSMLWDEDRNALAEEFGGAWRVDQAGPCKTCAAAVTAFIG